MDARRLATLVAIADHGSLAAAGRAIGLSHSAVSLRVKALEEAFGAALLDRSRRPPTLTPRGAAVAERARRLLELMAEIEAIGGREGLVGRLALGVAPSVATHLAPPALSALRAAHPALSLTLETGLSSALIAAVAAGRLDAAVATLPEAEDRRAAAALSGLSVREIAREPLVAIAPAAAKEREIEALLGAHPFIWFSREAWAGRAIERRITERGLSVSGGMEVASIEAVEALVRVGLGVSVIPERAAAPRSEDLRRLPFDAPGAYRTLGYFTRPAGQDPAGPGAAPSEALYRELVRAARARR